MYEEWVRTIVEHNHPSLPNPKTLTRLGHLTCEQTVTEMNNFIKSTWHADPFAIWDVRRFVNGITSDVRDRNESGRRDDCSLVVNVTTQ